MQYCNCCSVNKPFYYSYDMNGKDLNELKSVVTRHYIETRNENITRTVSSQTLQDIRQMYTVSQEAKYLSFPRVQYKKRLIIKICKFNAKRRRNGKTEHKRSQHAKLQNGLRTVEQI